MTRRLARYAALSCSLALLACLGSVGPDQLRVPTDPATITYAPALGVNIAAMTRDTLGLYYQDIVVGTGPVVGATDSVEVSFAGYLPTGVQFVSRPADATLRIRLPSQLLLGFREGLIGMAAGGKRKLVISPLLAYGFRELRDQDGRTIVPPNSVLVYDVELLARHE